MARMHATEYWNDVQKVLMAAHDFSRGDAARMVREYCERLGALGVADDVYHRSSEDTATVLAKRSSS